MNKVLQEQYDYWRTKHEAQANLEGWNLTVSPREDLYVTWYSRPQDPTPGSFVYRSSPAIPHYKRGSLVAYLVTESNRGNEAAYAALDMLKQHYPERYAQMERLMAELVATKLEA